VCVCVCVCVSVAEGTRSYRIRDRYFSLHIYYLVFCYIVMTSLQQPVRDSNSLLTDQLSDSDEELGLQQRASIGTTSWKEHHGTYAAMDDHEFSHAYIRMLPPPPPHPHHHHPSSMYSALVCARVFVCVRSAVGAAFMSACACCLIVCLSVSISVTHQCMCTYVLI
jgi:hypothetical protein